MTDPAPCRDAAVLFDLDGTFADTAPDMAATLNRMRVARGLEPLAPALVRPRVSHGARGVLNAGFGVTPQDAEFAPLCEEYLALYAEHLVEATAPFPGMAELVDALEQRGILWGIVTNKYTSLTLPLLEGIGYLERAACVVCGDTAAHPKPYPDPLLLACERIGVDPRGCWYVGDDERDIQAGRAAGMGTLVALFGYLGIDTDPQQWGADGAIGHPLEVLDWLPRAD